MTKLLKRILICGTASFTGVCYVTYSPKTMSIYCYNKCDENTNNANIPSYIYLSENSDTDFDESIESTWMFWKKTSLPVYWKLLMLGKSKEYKVRHKAVNSLSKLNLEKWQYAVVAQASDLKTAVGFARSHKINPHFFLPPPFKDLNEGNLQSELHLFISSLELSQLDICTENLVKQVVKSSKSLLKNGYNVDLEFGDPFVIYHTQQKKKAIFLYDKLWLETVLVLSTNSSHRNLVMKEQILKLLLKVLYSHKNESEIQSLIAQILANLAMDEKFRSSIFLTGWVGILSELKKSPYINVSLPAAKALANMDCDDLSHSIYDDGVYLLNPLGRVSPKDLSLDVIFIHGLFGGTFWTWRQCDSQNKAEVHSDVEEFEMSGVATTRQYSRCWPKEWLATDIPSLRIISVDYKTFVSNWRSYCPQVNEKNFISERAREIMDKLLLANVGDRPIIWITHSMGGLIVKQILVESSVSKDEKVKSFLKNTAGIVFYSVPHKGSQLANKIKSASIILQPASSIQELQKDSVMLLSLHEKFKDSISKYEIPILSFGETKKSRWGLTMVPLDSADPGLGEFYTLQADHLSTCKPVSPKSPEYFKLLNFLEVSLSKVNANKTLSLPISDKIFEISKIMCLIP